MGEAEEESHAHEHGDREVGRRIPLEEGVSGRNEEPGHEGGGEDGRGNPGRQAPDPGAEKNRRKKEEPNIGMNERP